jgi:hypothetical protein
MMKWVNELIRAFSKKEVQVVEKKEKKRCSPSLSIKEMQIKPLFNSYPVRIATIKEE